MLHMLVFFFLILRRCFDNDYLIEKTQSILPTIYYTIVIVFETILCGEIVEKMTNLECNLRHRCHRNKSSIKEITNKRRMDSDQLNVSILLLDVFISQGRHQYCNIDNNSCLMFPFEAKLTLHDDVIKWKHSPRYWHFVRGIHRSPHRPAISH